MPGAAEALQRIRSKGVRTAVVSNFDTRLRRILAELHADSLFDAVVVSAELQAEKPNPVIFQARAARSWGSASPGLLLLPAARCLPCLGQETRFLPAWPCAHLPDACLAPAAACCVAGGVRRAGPAARAVHPCGRRPQASRGGWPLCGSTHILAAASA